MTDADLVSRLNNLYAMLEQEGYYTKANTAAYAVDRIHSLNDDVTLLLGKINDEITRREEAELKLLKFKNSIKRRCDDLENNGYSVTHASIYNILKSILEETE